MKNNKSQSIMKRLLAIAVSLLVVLSMAVLPASAEASQAVADKASKGVFKIMYCCPDPDNRHDYLYPISIGSGFLVNETTVITCYHVFHNADLIAAMKETYGNNWRNKMEIRVYYSSGSFYTATEIQSVANSTADFTALKLSKPLNGSLSLPLKGNTEESVHRTDEVYALGFSSALEYIEDRKASSLTSADVEIRTGNVNKLASVDGVQTINHSAALKPAMSGGPLLDTAGNVIGINAATTGDSGVYNYAISIDPLINSLNVNNIEYKTGDSSAAPSETDETTVPQEETTAADETTAAPAVELDWVDFNSAFAQASAKTEDGFTAESFAALKEAMTLANSVKNKGDSATQDEIDQAAAKLTQAISALAEKPAGAPMKTMIIIAAAVVLVLAVIIIIVVASRKGKNIEVEMAPAQASNNQNPYDGNGWKSTNVGPAPNFNVHPSSDSAETGVLSGGGTATTVLSAGSNETTVLNSKPYATLTRKSTNETIQVNASPFVIGKERRKVSYCISDNNTISRSHAQIVKNGANVSIVDMNSKNGTFVNGVKCDVNAAVTLKSGDKITLSDEDFIFNTL